MILADKLGGRFRAAKTAARSGDYQLFLGAGASVGAVTRNGALPLAPELVRMLKERFRDAPIADGDSLARAYQRALRVSSEDEIWKTFREIFLHSRHEDWFRSFAGLPWRRVWTLNVDDAFENSYQAGIRSASRKIRSISWDDPYSETSDLEIVHLHGHVLAKDPRRLVFSFSEYIAAARERPVWDAVLGGVLTTKPVLAFGARLLDDPDIESLFLNSKPMANAPSIVIDPFISDGNTWELRQAGFVVIRASGRELTEAWQEEFGLADEQVQLMYTASGVDLPQMTVLQTNHVPPPPRGHDFYGGDEPVWWDSCHSRPALFDWMRKALVSIESWLDSSDQDPTVHVVYGDRLVGASAGLLTIAREARNLHVEAVMFDRSSRFDVNRFLDFCHGRGPVLLLMDGAADFGDDIDKLAIEAMKRDATSLYILLMELPWNDLKLEGRLVGNYTKFSEKNSGRLTRRDASAVAVKLAEFGRLGSLEAASPGNRIKHFRDRDIFSSLVDVEYASGFRRRLEHAVTELDADWKRDLVLLLSLASQGSRQVGLIDASLALGVSTETVSAALVSDEHLTALVELNGDRLAPRQRDHTVEPLVRLRGEASALEALLAMIKGLAPLATRPSLRERNRAAVLVGMLMSSKQLRGAFPGQDLDPFFESLRPTFGDWNGRFWEQRAIYAKSLRDWARAESFAARAVSLYDDAFTRTTYGTILINKAQSLARLKDEMWSRFYERGRDEFEAAASREPGNRVTVFAFLEAALALLGEVRVQEASGGLEKDSEQLLNAVEDWQSRYAQLRLSMRNEAGFESSVQRAEKLSERFSNLVLQNS